MATEASEEDLGHAFDGTCFETVARPCGHQFYVRSLAWPTF